MEVVFEVKISCWLFSEVSVKSKRQCARFWRTAALQRCAGSRIAVIFAVKLELIDARDVERTKLGPPPTLRTHERSILDDSTVRVINF